MITFHTCLKVADNSGARKVQCIKILKGSMHKYASIGDTLVTTIKRVKTQKKLKKGLVRKGVVVHITKNYQRQTGLSFKFKINRVVMLSEQGNPIATRIFGPIPKELRNSNVARILALAQLII